MSHNPSLKMLTPREAEVRNLLIHRRTVEQIARVLKITPACVHVHTSRIKAKIGFTPGAKPGAPDSLTVRQREAVKLYGEGCSQKQVAEIMGIAEQSVNTLIYQARRRQPHAIGTLRDPMFD